MSRREPEEVGAVLARVVRLNALDRQLAAHSVSQVWDRVAGARLAPHTRGAIAGPGRLVVEARSAVWLHEASLAREELRRRLQQELPGTVITEVRVRLGGDFPPPPGAPPVAPPALVQPGDVEAVRRELERAGAQEGAGLAARAAALARRRRGRTPR